jgi:cellulose biosynthesis protein BcsQ
MTDPTSNAPAHPVLLFAQEADLINDIVFEAAQPDADQRFPRFVFDAAQTYRAEDARGALARGFENRPYLVLLLGGDAAVGLRRGALDSLISASLSASELVVVGLAENDDQRSHLAALGVARICSMVNFRREFPMMVRAAVSDQVAKQEAQAEKAATGGMTVVVNQSPKRGILPDQGVITIHSTKGGSGKTTIATNLAWALALSKRGTVLVDLNADGANADQHLLRYIKQREEYDPDQIFEMRGLSVLARSMRHEVTFGVIPPEALAQAMIQVTDHLAFLPGVRDQSDYRAGIDGADQTVANLLSKTNWVEKLMSQLRAPASGHSYVVIDTGTSRYTAMGYTAMDICDLLILVVNASMPTNLAADLKAAHEIIENRYQPLRARKIIVANLLQRDNSMAPTLSDVRRKFEFFEAERVIPIHADWNALMASNVRGMPYLADLKNWGTPLGAELFALVNTVSSAYDLDDMRGAANKGTGFGRLFGRDRG